MNSRAGLPHGIRKILLALVLLGASFHLVFSSLNPDRSEASGNHEILPALIEGSLQARGTPDADGLLCFPEDHGAHVESHLESWRFTGMLRSKQDRSFAFQLVVLRIGFEQEIDSSKSAWRARQLYRGHLTLTDIGNDQFYSYERFSRAALELSGADTNPIRVWVEDWTFDYQANANATPVFQVQTFDTAVKLDMKLALVKPPADPGDAGLFGNGRRQYNAYLASGLRGQGHIELNSERIAVDGSASLEHAWGGIPLPGGQIAWDRFLFQLDDGRTLNCLRLRRRGGGGKPISSCLVIHVDGSIGKLGRQDVDIEVVDTWISPLDGVRYPSRWQFHWPAETLRFEIKPVIANQEVHESMRFWSGAASLRGESINGHGFVDLLGYAPKIATQRN